MSLYENRTYTIEIGDIALTDGTSQKIYQLINKDTKVIEEQIPQLVVALAAADELSQALVEFWEAKETADVRSLNVVNNSIQ